jgi:hypothetical protein
MNLLYFKVIVKNMIEEILIHFGIGESGFLVPHDIFSSSPRHTYRKQYSMLLHYLKCGRQV